VATDEGAPFRRALVIEFFPERWQAERMVAEVLWDEPSWSGTLRVEKIEFRTGTAN
jgi:hypothetical protein